MVTMRPIIRQRFPGLSSGVDANPHMASHCRLRFERDIEQGRMTVVNAGIQRAPGELVFYVNLLDHGWSSFEPGKGRKPGTWQDVKVACLTTQQLIANYGRPFFMKVDIEGSDIQALESVTPATAPAYVSVELNQDDLILETLIDLGYSAFKFVDGATYRPTPPIFNHEFGWRLMRKITNISPIIRSRNQQPSLSACIRKSEWNPPGKYSPDGYQFTHYCSGPFGEQAAGRWLKAEAARHWFQGLKHGYQRVDPESGFLVGRSFALFSVRSRPRLV